LPVGLKGRNAANETEAVDSTVRWNGIGCVIENVREAGKKSFVTIPGLKVNLDCKLNSWSSHSLVALNGSNTVYKYRNRAGGGFDGRERG